MKQHFRIHGDNVVECERILELILTEVNPVKTIKSLISPSTIAVQILFNHSGVNRSWYIELMPGFNKSGRSRWEADIFEPLRQSGSFLDETPDAIITEICDNTEEILCAIEFCSALQAGNQAWQRSGRAFSTGRTGFIPEGIHPDGRGHQECIHHALHSDSGLRCLQSAGGRP